MYTEIFENYETFLTENQDSLSSPSDVVKLLNDEGMFRSYADSLVEGLDSNIREPVLEVLNRQRESLIQESSNVPASSFASGWTVLSFPILTDIYAEPIISELCNVYPVDKAIASIPRVKIKATIKSFDGSSETTEYMPNATSLIRAGEIKINAAPNSTTNVFSTAGLDSSLFRMNRRYTLMTNIQVTEDDGSNTHVHTVPVNFRPDNRSQITETVVFTDSANNEVELQITAHVDYERGTINFHSVQSGGAAGSSYAVDFAEFSLRFIPEKTMNGRVRVQVEQSASDITIDPNEDFLIELTEEDIQDFQAIYKIDLLRTLSNAIKRQVMLNKDYDLSYFLRANENEMSAQGAYLTVDMDKFAASGGNFAPDNPHDILKGIIPYISTLMGTVYRNYLMYPSYLVTGNKTASMLRSLQSMMVRLGGTSGELGFSGEMAQFLKLRILESSAIEDNKIYMSIKAPQNALEQAAIFDVIYKPLYVVNEVTDGNTRQFVRSRSLIEVARTDGLGCIQVNNLGKYIG